MDKSSNVNHLFEILDQTAELIEKAEDVTYLEALCLTGENIFKAETVQTDLKDRLDPLYDQFFVEGMTSEEVRRAFQLAVLKGMKASAQPQHQMTPDAIALFMGYLVNKLFPSDSYKLLDQAAGSGNLLTAVINHTEGKASGIGIEVDDLLIRLAQTNANLQQLTIDLFQQDALRPLLLEPVDAVMADLPVGYYPDEDNAAHFRLGQDKTRLYSPYLMIEQGLKYTKEAGFLMYLIPNDLFEWDETKEFHTLLKDEAVILGLLQLPLSLFKDQRHAKSILMLQKRGEDVETPDEALLAKLPSFQNQNQLADIMQQIDEWFRTHLPNINRTDS